ncbi:MAG: hypothetical protein COU69_04270 [Candidatus Pacebacteria bacterium CG10_big_fil_rev_8_21_14_0_10_56_10]|nr:MAG: hypothetical protein COU69_04270 [Candidatus Pacebacteria bacterium CG10_big_fil_rev_8_21_14_0_10_56_10]
MPYVITCGDEGVQINEGTRLGVVGAGFKVPHFSRIVTSLKKLFDKDIRIAANEENLWIKQQLELATWEQTNASAQQQTEALADQQELLYAGYLPFADPRELKHGIKGHMVRPREVHIATKIAFTLGGGEQTYHLGQYLVSAEWVSSLKPTEAKEALQVQVNFYQSIAGDNRLAFAFEEAGELDTKTVDKNRQVLYKLGYTPSE